MEKVSWPNSIVFKSYVKFNLFQFKFNLIYFNAFYRRTIKCLFRWLRNLKSYNNISLRIRWNWFRRNPRSFAKMTILTCKLNNNISVFQFIHFQLNSKLQNLHSSSNIIYKIMKSVSFTLYCIFNNSKFSIIHITIYWNFNLYQF